MNHRYFIHLAYHGASFHGWQKQPNAMSVQQLLEEGFSTVLRQQIELTGCGRTDTGVHARDFYAHFDSNIAYSQEFLDQLGFKMNRFFPTSVVIFRIFEVPIDLHARFSAVSRAYRYYLNRQKDPFTTDQAFYLFGNLDVDLMNQACDILKQHRDFSCFSKSNTQTKTNNCIITEAYWNQTDSQLVFFVKADRFLRNMVRAIVGTMIEIGQHKLSLEEFRNVLERKNRSLAGESVPPQGLFLEKVEYSEF